MRRAWKASLGVGLLAACSAGSDGNAGAGGNGGPLGGGAANGVGGDTAMFGTGTGSTGSGTGTTTRPIGDSQCQAIVNRGEQIPLDIYIMFDTSLSMTADAGGMNRLDAVRGAVNQFVADPASGGLGVGIGYFGYMTVGTTSCNPADYQAPEVPIAPLPGNAGAITNSLNGKQPTGETPTGAAIRGGCSYAKSWASQNPGHVTVMLLVTDGVPEAPLSGLFGCSPTLPDAVQAAAECTGSPPQVPVYVLGVGPSLQNLTQIAQAGGSQQAYLVEGGNVSQQVLDALNAIRGSAQVPCQFKIPPPPAMQELNFDMVNVELTPPGSTTPGLVYYVGDPAQCNPTQGGWFYDSVAAPTTINLCPTTCSAATVTVGATVDISLGCGTERPPA